MFSYRVENNFIAGDGTSCFSKHTKVLLSYHLIIHLGDLYRYQSLVLPPPSDGSSLFKDAEMMYKQAIALDPSNGLGHHQLAVLSTKMPIAWQCIAIAAHLLALFLIVMHKGICRFFSLRMKNSISKKRNEISRSSIRSSSWMYDMDGLCFLLALCHRVHWDTEAVDGSCA